MTLPVAILRTGAVTSVGKNAPSTFAALRTRLNNFDETLFIDTRGVPVAAGALVLGGEEDRLASTGKLVAMLAQAIRECLADVPGLDLRTLPLLLCVAEVSRPGRLAQLESRLKEGIEAALTTAFAPQSAIYAYGQASAMMALNDSFALIHSHPLVLIAAVDSYLSPATLRAMLSADRILTSTNPQGFIPGEAACALLVGAPHSIARLAPRFSNVRPDRDGPQSAPASTLFCTGLGVARELAIRGGAAPNKASALSTAIRAALAGMPQQASGIGLRISAQSSEDFYAKEFAMATARTDVSASALWMLADSLGETGAAAGLLTIAWAYASAHKAYAPSLTMLCLAASDEGDRAAALLGFGQYQA
ncbi:hypothetical protein F2P45_15440 [Massilia sp. CCM 8733]|uniref:3-oxoacyl-ACP synthase n=1 Tax=Massilia mucilaginosa TaxID=2609282 RepID=A0ABX0NUH2_9BURK|nr:hypothetical protein [Massilia mucilaginosa]NHZ90401.1 hypothetical protein [Massilia mucilaginosa]